jgi:hypothetical protein
MTKLEFQVEKINVSKQMNNAQQFNVSFKDFITYRKMYFSSR